MYRSLYDYPGYFCCFLTGIITLLDIEFYDICFGYLCLLDMHFANIFTFSSKSLLILLLMSFVKLKKLGARNNVKEFYAHLFICLLDFEA